MKNEVMASSLHGEGNLLKSDKLDFDLIKKYKIEDLL
jgi:hypothetical protein